MCFQLNIDTPENISKNKSKCFPPLFVCAEDLVANKKTLTAYCYTAKVSLCMQARASLIMT